MSDLEVMNKPIGSDEGIANGLTNGIANGSPDHKSSESKGHKEHKHKSKDKDRDRERDRHKSSHKDKSREKDRDRHKDKDRHSSSHKSTHKDKDKDRDRHKERERSDKEKDRHRDKEKDRHRDKERHRDKNRERSDKDKSSHRERDKDKERSDRHKDKDRSKDKERSKEEKDRSRDDKEKERKREKEKSRDDKEKRSSSHGDRKDKDRHSSHKSSHKDKHKDRTAVKMLKVQEALFDAISPAKPFVALKEEPKEEFLDDSASNYFAIKQESVDSEEEQLVIKEELFERSEGEEEPAKEESEEDLPLSARHKAIIIKKEELDEQEDDNDDMPLSARKKIKTERRPKTEDEDFKPDEDDKPLISRKKIKPEKKKRKTDDDEDDYFKPEKKKIKKEKAKKTKVKREFNDRPTTLSPTKKKKKEDEELNVWKWWEEEKRDDGQKWNYLQHRGPVFPPSYDRLPSSVKFYYKGEHMVLSEDTEEVAGFYARMLDHDYATKEVFNRNFFKDWRKVMTSKERERIVDLKKCDFTKLNAYFIQKNEDRKNRSKEEKKALKEENQKIIDEYGWCTIDGHKQRIGNFKIEPPGLFRGRGEHPKQGRLKKRLMPEDVMINCSKDSALPKAPSGHRWKETRHDSAVTWLACWVENIQGQFKYVMLNAASKLKGEKDWQKYEIARRLHKIVDRIRENYKADWKSKEMRIRQRSVALYFIDKLALRAGNEKDEDQADTVGCCSLRVEHITLHEKKDRKEYVVVFDFLGKDSIRYYNEVQVEKRVFKNLQLFMENKQEGDDLFDRLNTQIMNKHLNELMEGLTAKVFRTYNASRTLQEQLDKVTNSDDPIPAMVLSYNRANREVAILCNHQRSVPKTFEKSMANLVTKIDEKKKMIDDMEADVKDAKRAAKHGGSVKEKTIYDKKKKALERFKEQLVKLEISATDKEENKQIALGTSKLNYLDPRISVAWCKKYDVPLEKVYNKTQRQKFQWAIDMATSDYNFLDEPSTMSMNDGDEEEEEE